ncbi:FecR domain-containing protein [Chloroflexota bacterium]
MSTKLNKILDDCIEQVMEGETIEAALAKYPDMREKLEPLLRTALSVSSIPKVKPSPEFVKMSKVRLMRLIRQQSIQTSIAKTGKRVLVPNRLAIAIHSLWQNYISAKKLAILVTSALLLVSVASVGQFVFLKPTPAMASTCVLSILSGSVRIQNPGLDTYQEGFDGMTLNTGTQIETASDSHALLTFFEGSTIKLEPNTSLEIQQVEYSDEQPTMIILKQWLGRTWSRVTKMVDSGSQYEIETPTATAIVRGTLFTTEVTETGFTTVATTEGLVSVAAQEQEVYVPANQKVEVEKGTAPSKPAALPSPKSEIIVIINGPAVGSISDPTGSSTGILPTGLEFNQIQDSYSSHPTEDTQIITIAEPVNGQYTFTFRHLTEGKTGYRIQGKTYDKINFNYTGSLDIKKDSGYLVHLDLQVDEGEITGADISESELLGDKMPEKVVDGKLYKKDSPPGKDTVDEAKDVDKKDSPPGKDTVDEAKDVDKKDSPPGKDKVDEAKDVDKKDSPPGKDKVDKVKDDDKKDTPPGKDKVDKVKDDDKKDSPPDKDSSKSSPAGLVCMICG